MTGRMLQCTYSICCALPPGLLVGFSVCGHAVTVILVFAILLHAARRARAVATIFPPLKPSPVHNYKEPYRGSLISFPPCPPNNGKEKKTQRKSTFCLSRPVSSTPTGAQTPLGLHPLPPSLAHPKSGPCEGPRPPVLIMGATIFHRAAPVLPTPLDGVSPLVPPHMLDRKSTRLNSSHRP